MTTMFRNTSHVRRACTMLSAAAVFFFVLQYDNDQCQICNRRLQDHLVSTRTPLHILVLESNVSDSESGEESPSNDNDDDDESQVNWSISDSQPQLYRAANTDNRARRLGIIALSLASAFAALMMITVAFAWTRYSRSVVTRDPDEVDQRECVADPMSYEMDGKLGADGGGSVSILRNGVSPIADYNPGRRVRFQLPGSSSSVDQGVVAAAECEEPYDVPLDEEPKTKKVKISVQEERHPDSVSSNTACSDDVKKELENASLSGSSNTACSEDVKKVLENATLPPKVEMKNDAEAWVNRIMHPWLNSCCPEVCCNLGNDNRPRSSLGSIQDQSTVASNSFESSNSSKAVSSVTPLFPTPFPTSTFDSPYDGDDDEEATAATGPTNLDEESAFDSVGILGIDEETACETVGVLGILGRSDVRNDDEDLVVLEEIHDHHQNKRPRDSLDEPFPPPPRPRARRDDDGWFKGEYEYETAPKTTTKSRSSWRKRAWQTVGNESENIHTSNPLEEFDIESCSGMEGENNNNNADGRRWRLVEI